MAGGLTEAQRGILLSNMSTESAAMMLGRSQGWVCRQRSVLVDLPGQRPVQARVAQAAKPWRPDEDPFSPPVAPVAVRRASEARPETWREAGVAAVRAAFAATQPEPRPDSPAGRPARRWNDLRPAAARPAPKADVVPDPAVLSEKSYERNFVRSKRAQGISWQNIARMLGKCEAQLRGEYGGAL